MSRVVELQPITNETIFRAVNYPTNGANALKPAFELVVTKPKLSVVDTKTAAVSKAQPEFDAAFLADLVFESEPVVPHESSILDKMIKQAAAPAVISNNDLDIKPENVVSFSSKGHEPYQAPVDHVKETIDYLSKNMSKFEWLARSVQNQAISLAAACAPGDGHSALQSNATNINGETNATESNNSSVTGERKRCEHKKFADECEKCKNHNH